MFFSKKKNYIILHEIFIRRHVIIFRNIKQPLQLKNKTFLIVNSELKFNKLIRVRNALIRGNCNINSQRLFILWQGVRENKKQAVKWKGQMKIYDPLNLTRAPGGSEPRKGLLDTAMRFFFIFQKKIRKNLSRTFSRQGGSDIMFRQ